MTSIKVKRKKRMMMMMIMFALSVALVVKNSSNLLIHPPAGHRKIAEEK